MARSIEANEAVGQGRAAKGRRTREAILKAAVDSASVDGLEGLTIGRLAAELHMSKSGLFAHFGSKEELQLATIEAAREIFVEEAIRPALTARRGLPRLWKMCEAWLAYAQREVFRGGCFFTAASFEFDSRPGPVRDRIAESMREWLGALERASDQAKEEGHVDPHVDTAQIAFELNALAMGANWSYQLFGDGHVFAMAREAMRARLYATATPSGRVHLGDGGRRRTR